ncbi:MAG: alpha/beta hydrolase [Pseudomonadota bacterium]
MTPEQISALRTALPPLAEATSLSAEQQAYCRYYGIDFSDTWPAIKHRFGYVTSGHFQLAVHYYTNPKATSTLLLVHGYFDHSGLFGNLIEFGLSMNCNVLAFDLPGHGMSTGEPAVIDDFADYARAVNDVLKSIAPIPLPLWVMAQSTGCAALVEYARRYRWSFLATVLLAPLGRPKGWRQGRILHTVIKPFVKSIPRTFSRNSSDEEFLSFIQTDPLQSLRLSLRWVGALKLWLKGLSQTSLGVGSALIVQGDKDQTVDWKYNLKLYKVLFPGSRVVMLPGAGHHLAKESKVIRDNYLQQVAGELDQKLQLKVDSA